MPEIKESQEMNPSENKQQANAVASELWKIRREVVEMRAGIKNAGIAVFVAGLLLAIICAARNINAVPPISLSVIGFSAWVVGATNSTKMD